jgi:hypothetical protein
MKSSCFPENWKARAFFVLITLGLLLAGSAVLVAVQLLERKVFRCATQFQMS